MGNGLLETANPENKVYIFMELYQYIPHGRHCSRQLRPSHILRLVSCTAGCTLYRGHIIYKYWSSTVSQFNISFLEML